MKWIIIFSVCVIVCTAEFYEFPKDDYTPEKLRSDNVELKKRVDCFLDKQPCTHLTSVYKKIAPELVQTVCAKCSPEFKVLTRAFLEGIKEKYPDEYKELISKYDVSSLYFNKLEDAVGCRKTILS